ncbi:hypothetical protein EAF00_000954 [Botryotinia globosa]|nr:hypothetical protein EAF00_000954 [Botryotinia globosa]
MCKTVLVKAPCWCNGNNGKIVTLREYQEECANVSSGGSHDEYELIYTDLKIVKVKCEKCPHLEVEADRLETEVRERKRAEIDRVEAQKVAEEQASQVAAQGGYRGGYQGGYRGGYQGGY